MSAAVEHTFVANVAKFYKEPKFLHCGKYTHLFALPATQAELFEPLERMRAIVGNLRACAKAAFPSNHFLRTVQCYSLPSKLVQPGANRDDTPTKKSFRRIFETCGFAAVSQQMLAELTRMAPAADAAFARRLNSAAILGHSGSRLP